ncbi:HalOD1 output domain-containing protein [Halorubrum sp. AD140]|uniref:HalOD1 output domain-containing protein n=1 Tax=Halorubrum sp. AD140 TaxID=3050073 RepID=UPI002ACCEA98|nr:HalOD1 output domain-containing protein [Halorubrum sp. AD140]MDZ5811936.1 HalOD1 output domain-containing protein [Halorubrum sp. AD140]
MGSDPIVLYRECTPVVDAHYRDGSDRTPVAAIVRALAEVEGLDATTLPPLYDMIDADALNQLFERNRDESDTAVFLSFQYNTWNIFVRDDGQIRICDATKPTDPEPVFSSVAP